MRRTVTTRPRSAVVAALSLAALAVPVAGYVPPAAAEESARPCGSARADYTGTYEGRYQEQWGKAVLRGDGIVRVTWGTRKASGRWQVEKDFAGRWQVSAQLGAVGLYAYPDCRPGTSKAFRLEVPPNSRAYITRTD